MEITLSEMKIILCDAEKKHGKAYFDSDPVSQQKCSVLPHALKRCFELLEADLGAKKTKISAVSERERNVLFNDTLNTFYLLLYG